MKGLILNQLREMSWISVIQYKELFWEAFLVIKRPVHSERTRSYSIIISRNLDPDLESFVRNILKEYKLL